MKGKKKVAYILVFVLISPMLKKAIPYHQESSLFELKSPYNSYLKQGRWDEYISALCEDGLIWWFNMEIPCIVAHLLPLTSAPANSPSPHRLSFFTRAVGPTILHEMMDHLYHTFERENDLEASFAVAGAGVASIWDSGNNYQRYQIWHQRINNLLKMKEKVSPLAVASIYSFKGLIELTGHGDIHVALKNYNLMRYWAEKADSPSLRTFHGAAVSYSLLWMGRLSEAEIILSDIEPLCNMPETSMVCNIYFQTTLGLFHTVSGNPEKGEEVLREIIDLPFFEQLPPPAFFLGYGHLLYAVSHHRDIKAIDRIVQKLRTRVIPEQNYFHHSYMHFNIGIAYLLTGDPHRALLHSNVAIERGRLSKSPIAERMPALLYGQALSDMNRNDEALDHLLEWINKWQEANFNIIASTAALEIAHLYLKKGMVDKARVYYEKAAVLLPSGEEIRSLYRHEGFLEKLKNSLYPDTGKVDTWVDSEHSAIRIETFGGLRIRIGDNHLYDRNWRGGRTKALLKALIVYGGTKVPADRLIDILWPDTEGDMAMGNLKVAISRLRRIGLKKDESPLPWIKVRHGQVSLARPLCAVDSIRFQDALTDLKDRDSSDLLVKVLNLYKDDFLPYDTNEIWIIRHREQLREAFVRGVVTFTELCKNTGKTDEALPYLQKAIDKDPLNEELYVRLMDLYLKMGYPAKALQVFKQAKEAIQNELGIEPGPSLLTLARKAGSSH